MTRGQLVTITGCTCPRHPHNGKRGHWNGIGAVYGRHYVSGEWGSCQTTEVET